MMIQRLWRFLRFVLGRRTVCRFVISLMLLGLMVMGLPALSSAQQTCQPDGDVDQNGSVTVLDALLASQQALSLVQLDACQQSIADVYPLPTTPDGTITVSDALCIFQKALSLPSCLDSAPSFSEPPIAYAGSDESVIENTLVTLSGSGSDPDGTIVSYAWEQTTGTPVTLAGANTPNPSFTAPEVAFEDVFEDFIFELTVTDNEGASATSGVLIVVLDSYFTHGIPTADAGPDQTAGRGALVTLSGSGSDPDGTIIHYEWHQISGLAVPLWNWDTPHPSFIAPGVFSDEELVFVLYVFDDNYVLATDTVTVTVRQIASAVLQVSVFGEGDLNVLGADNQLDCDAITLCEGTFDGGDDVVIEATPAAHWVLDGWYGCDQVNGNQCTVSLDDDHLVGVTFVSAVPNEFAEVSEVESISVEGGETITVAKNEILLYLDLDVSQEDYEAVLSRIIELGGLIIGALEEMGILQIRVPDDTEEAQFVDGLKDYPGVVAASFNVVEEFNGGTSGEAVPYYPDFSGDYWIEQIGMDRVWQYTQGSASSEAVIGIIDSGFPAIPSWHQGSISSGRLRRFNKSGVAILDNSDSRGRGNEYWHGAFVACMAAADTGFGRGVAWKNRVVSVDVASGTPIERTSYFQAMKVAVEKGADIINVSIGPPVETPRNLQGFRLVLTHAVVYAGINDALVVFASGNGGVKNDDRLLPTSADLKKVTEIIHMTDEHLTAAAIQWSENTLIVASVDDSNTEADTSTMGNAVNIAAPGVGVGCGLEDFEDENDFDLTASGTSFAAPLVAGTAALMKSVNPSLSAPEIRSLIIRTASDNVNLSPGTNFPHFQLNACEAVRAAAPIETRDNISCGAHVRIHVDAYACHALPLYNTPKGRRTHTISMEGTAAGPIGAYVTTDANDASADSHTTIDCTDWEPVTTVWEREYNTFYIPGCRRRPSDPTSTRFRIQSVFPGVRLSHGRFSFVNVDTHEPIDGAVTPPQDFPPPSPSALLFVDHETMPDRCIRATLTYTPTAGSTAEASFMEPIPHCKENPHPDGGLTRYCDDEPYQ